MMINMMQTVMRNSIVDLVNALHDHLIFIPSEEKLTSTELDVTLEEPRPEEAPQLPFFIVDIALQPTELSLDPSEQVIKTIFRQIINLWEEDLTDVKSLIGDSMYSPFTK